MSRYIDPALADQLMEKDKDILGGKSTIATMLFSDVRGFTTLTEELGPHGTVLLLNEYFTIMVECVQREGGMLDKFIGDAIMAAFGMPIVHDDDEDRGVRAAISMMTELNEWNVKRLADGKKPVNIGIGINTDMVVSGNIGTPKRMDFTLIGDGVNLAARLESACKQYFANILISDNTYKKLKGIYRIREIDRVVVKGKTKPVVIYEVLDYHNDETFPNVMSAVDHFNHGIKLYRESKWDKSIEAFKETLNLNQKDNLSKMYIERCTNLKKNPPGDDWDGVWRMSTK
jgi:adenylate cyclase